MKFWFEGILEQDDGSKQCSKCRVWFSAPKNCFVEFEIFGGAMPNPQELHPEPTGKFMCESCAKMTLI